MPHAIRLEKNGGPEVMKWVEVDVGKPGPGQVRLNQTAVGVNFIDIYFRSGAYKAPAGFPFIPGSEAAGVVDAVGEGVTGLAVGDRVVYQGPLGSYAEVRLVPADRCVKIPEDIDDKTAAAVFLKGVTVYMLLFRTFPVTKDSTILWHAASGGVGTIACQWASALGATVIGTVGSAEKAKLAKAHGATHVINYRDEDFVKRVKEITDGKGVDVAYDFDRQGYVSRFARLSAPPGHVGVVRGGVRSAARISGQHAPAEGVAVRDPPDDRSLPGGAGRPRESRARALRRFAGEESKGRNRPGVSTESCGRRAHCPGIAEDHRIDGPRALILMAKPRLCRNSRHR